MHSEDNHDFGTYRAEIYKVRNKYLDLNVGIENQIPVRNDAFRFCYSSPWSNNLEIETLKIIDYAISTKQAIFLSNFIINYQVIVDKLIEAAETLKGKIFILTSFETNDPQVNFVDFDSQELHFSNIQQMVNVGIRVRSYSNAHWKIILTGHRGIVSSANYTYPAFITNPECGLIISGKHVKNIKNLFIDVWKHHTTKERRNTEIVNLPTNNLRHECSRIDFGKVIKLVSNFKNPTLAEKICRFMETHCTSSIKLMIWRLSNNEIINSLNKLAKSGKNIEIVFSETMKIYSKNLKYLNMLDPRISIKYFRRTHAKLLIIDQQRAVLSTGNYDNYLSDPDGLDLFVFTNNKKIIDDSIVFFDNIAKISSEDVPTTETGTWYDFIELDILIDLPNKVHHSIPMNLSSLMRKLKEASVEFYIFRGDLIIKYGRSFMKLIKSNENYKISIMRSKEKEMIGSLEPMFYEKIVFNFYWKSIL